MFSMCWRFFCWLPFEITHFWWIESSELPGGQKVLPVLRSTSPSMALKESWKPAEFEFNAFGMVFRQKNTWRYGICCKLFGIVFQYSSVYVVKCCLNNSRCFFYRISGKKNRWVPFPLQAQGGGGLTNRAMCRHFGWRCWPMKKNIALNNLCILVLFSFGVFSWTHDCCLMKYPFLGSKAWYQ